MFLGYQVPELASSSTCFLSYGQFHKTQSNNTFERSDDPATSCYILLYLAISCYILLPNSFSNTPCVGTSGIEQRNGTCYTEKECKQRNGFGVGEFLLFLLKEKGSLSQVHGKWQKSFYLKHDQTSSITYKLGVR